MAKAIFNLTQFPLDINKNYPIPFNKIGDVNKILGF